MGLWSKLWPWAAGIGGGGLLLALLMDDEEGFPMAAPGDFNKLVAKLGISQAFSDAIIQVESGGKAFVKGRLIIRFEPHWFRAYSTAETLGIIGKRKTTAAERDRYGITVLLPGMSVPTSDDGFKRSSAGGLIGQQEREYEALARAASYFPDSAYRSTSFGVGQIMGFNAKAAGYPSARAMFDAFSKSEEEQRVGMLRFILSDPNLLRAARDIDFWAFAGIYNGNQQARYAPLLERAYNDFAVA